MMGLEKLFSYLLDHFLFMMLWTIRRTPDSLIQMIRPPLEYLIRCLLSTVLYKRERVVHKNLKIVYKEKTEKDRNIFVKKYKKTLIRNYIDIALLIIKKRSINKILGMENLNNSLKKGKGIIFLTWHTNHFFLLLYVLNKYGISTYTFIKPSHVKKIYEMEKNYILSLGHHFIVVSNSYQALRESIHAIKNKCYVGFFFDQNFNAKTAKKVDFMGEKVNVSTGILNIALKFDVPIIPIYTKEDENHQYQVIYRERI